jgi:putative transport protein
LSVQRLKRDGASISITPETWLQLGDQIVIAAQTSVFINAAPEIGPEFDDFETLAVPIITAVVTNRIAVGKTLGELAADRQIFRGLYLESLARGEEEMPRQARLMVERGDVLKLVGSP